MLTRIERLLVPPLFEDEEKTQAANWLNAILLLILAATAITAPLLVIFQEYLGFLITAASGVLCLVLLIFARRGLVQTTSILLVFKLLAIASLSAYTSNGIDAGAITAYFLILAITALLLGRRAVLCLALLSILALWGLFYAQSDNRVSSYEFQSSFIKWS